MSRIYFRNGPHGYGVVTKLLHWLTVLAIVGQFVIGLTMDADAGAERADDAVDTFEERGEERAGGQGEAAEERFEAEVERREEAIDSAAESVGSETLRRVLTGAAFRDGLTGLEAHLLVGLLVLVLGLTRLVWRRVADLPPWAPHLSAAERTLESRLEKTMLSLLLLVPGSGLLLLLVSDDLVAVHVTAQVALLLAIGVHVALVLRHTVFRRHRHLSRML